MKISHLLAVASALITGLASAATPGTDRLVVKYKDSSTVSALLALTGELNLAGQPVKGVVKTLPSGAKVVQLASWLSLEEARSLAARVALSPAVSYAAPDIWVRAQTLSNDPFASVQWPLQAGAGGANFEAARGLSGTNKVLVAVVDTGSVNHADVTAHEIAGYDFVSDSATGGDGDGRDADPTDPGDFCESEGTKSSWHGLRVSGVLTAIANNGIGIAGAAPDNARVLQVRALGRCGGYLSDVADAVAWAAGTTVTGVPANPNPAKVINLSLGSTAGVPCYAYMQDAVNAATSVGAVVVAAAGNEGANGVGAPANCTGVIAVGAHTASGDLATYSNYSTTVTLTAPGGGACKALATCNTQATVSLSNSGTQTVGANLEGAYFAGTSAATPHVSAAVAMLLAVNPQLSPADVQTILKASARPHPAGTFCANNLSFCGAGMLDAQAALKQVLYPSVSVAAPKAAVAGSSPVSLTAAVSASSADFKYHWAQKSGTSVALRGADSATLTFTAPPTKGLDLVFTVTATSAYTSASQDVSVKVNNAPQFELPVTVKLTQGTAWSLPLAVADADSDKVTFTVLGKQGVQVSNGTLSWSAPTVSNASAASETFTLTVTATDGALDGSGDTTHSMAVTVVNPSISEAPVANSTTSGGGGALGWPSLLVLFAGTVVRRKRIR